MDDKLYNELQVFYNFIKEIPINIDYNEHLYNYFSVSSKDNVSDIVNVFSKFSYKDIHTESKIKKDELLKQYVEKNIIKLCNDKVFVLYNTHKIIYYLMFHLLRKEINLLLKELESTKHKSFYNITYEFGEKNLEKEKVKILIHLLENNIQNVIKDKTALKEFLTNICATLEADYDFSKLEVCIKATNSFYIC